MPVGVGAPEIEPQHRKTLSLQRQSKTAKAFPATGTTEAMKGQNKGAWRYGITRGRGQRAIQKGQQIPGCCCTTGQC